MSFSVNALTKSSGRASSKACAAASQTAKPKMPPLPPGVAVETDIAYDRHPQTVLDVILPPGNGNGKRCGVLAIHGGVCIDLSRMNHILAVNIDDLDATVQAGVTRKQLNQHLHDTGLFFPIDPGADATLGGMAATRAAGTNAVRYGTMKENVLGLTVVLADGGVIRTGGRARKSSAGYDLTRLMVGSEGTLGIITEAWLRLQDRPTMRASAAVTFGDFAVAAEAVRAVAQAGLHPSNCRLLDPVEAEGPVVSPRTRRAGSLSATNTRRTKTGLPSN